METEFLIFSKVNKKVRQRGVVSFDINHQPSFEYEDLTGVFSIDGIQNPYNKNTKRYELFENMIDAFLKDEEVSSILFDKGDRINLIIERDGYNLYIDPYGDWSWW